MTYYNVATRRYSPTGGDGFAETELPAPEYRVGFLRIFGFDERWQEPNIAPVTSAQGQLALHNAGLLELVEAIIDQADTVTRIWYKSAQTWERDSAYVIQLGAALDLSESQIDALFLGEA